MFCQQKASVFEAWKNGMPTNGNNYSLWSPFAAASSCPLSNSESSSGCCWSISRSRSSISLLISAWECSPTLEKNKRCAKMYNLVQTSGLLNTWKRIIPISTFLISTFGCLGGGSGRRHPLQYPPHPAEDAKREGTGFPVPSQKVLSFCGTYLLK